MESVAMENKKLLEYLTSHNQASADDAELFTVLSEATYNIIVENVYDEKGQETAVQLPAMTDKNTEKHYIPAFLDDDEYGSWAESESGDERLSHQVSFTEISNFLLEDDNLSGIVINPFSLNVVLPADFLRALISVRMQQERGQGNTAQHNTVGAEQSGVISYSVNDEGKFERD